MFQIHSAFVRSGNKRSLQSFGVFSTFAVLLLVDLVLLVDQVGSTFVKKPGEDEPSKQRACCVRQ